MSFAGRPAFELVGGTGPVVAAAIHAGHDIRDELLALLAPDDAQRLREEDPYTSEWTCPAPTRVLANRSRFEVDLNRPRESAVYRLPEDAWGLTVWRGPLPEDALARSLGIHDAFYAALGSLLDGLVVRHGGFVVLDIHSYNHRRLGPDAAWDDAAANPEINIGTGSMDRTMWGDVVDAFIDALRAPDALGPEADVRENVKFKGGYLARWVHERYPRQGCAIAVEFKKTWMDEWTGEFDARAHARIGHALALAVPAVGDALARALA